MPWGDPGLLGAPTGAVRVEQGTAIRMPVAPLGLVSHQQAWTTNASSLITVSRWLHLGDGRKLIRHLSTWEIKASMTFIDSIGK